MKDFFIRGVYLLDYEIHRNQTKEDFDRVFDRNISTKLFYRYVLQG